MERHTMPVDVLFVGGGPASLAGAIHLMDLIQQHNATAPADEQLDAPMIALIDRGTALGASESGASQGGAQAVSGEVLDPVALQELVPDWQERGDFPLERTINRQDMYLLTEKRALKAPIVSPFRYPSNSSAFTSSGSSEKKRDLPSFLTPVKRGSSGFCGCFEEAVVEEAEVAGFLLRLLVDLITGTLFGL